MGILDRFVVRYIKDHFHHGVVDKRNMILRAVTDSMRDTFTEDNVVTRYSALIEWILENDTEYQTLIAAHPEFKSVMGKVLHETALKNFSKKVAENA